MEVAQRQLGTQFFVIFTHFCGHFSASDLSEIFAWNLSAFHCSISSVQHLLTICGVSLNPFSAVLKRWNQYMVVLLLKRALRPDHLLRSSLVDVQLQDYVGIVDIWPFQNLEMCGYVYRKWKVSHACQDLFAVFIAFWIADKYLCRVVCMVSKFLCYARFWYGLSTEISGWTILGWRPGRS